MIATPASSLLPQPPAASPSFSSASGALSSASLLGRGQSRFSSSRVSINPSRSSSTRAAADQVNPTSASSQADNGFKPSIVPGLRLRRPDPFRARLRERQRLRLQQLRSGNKEENKAPKAPKQSAAAAISPPRFPPGPPGRTPIFVSSRTENFNRRPKEVESKDVGSDVDSNTDVEFDNIRVPANIQSLRDRARARINQLFRRRRPNFARPRPGGSDDNDPLIVQESRRRKRQVSICLLFCPLEYPGVTKEWRIIHDFILCLCYRIFLALPLKLKLS